VASPGVRGWEGQNSEGLGDGSPQAGSRGSGAKPTEAEKHDINFALRITLVLAYCPCYSHIIITFVIEFSRSIVSHILICVHTSQRICANLQIESRAGCGGGAIAPRPRGDANVEQLGSYIILPSATFTGSL